MSDSQAIAPQLTTTVDQPYASLHVTVPREEIQKVMGPTLQKVYAAVAAQGLKPAGPWFTHHLRRPRATFDFEAGVPVGTRVEAAGDVEPRNWPAMTVVRAEFQGNYAGLGAAWAEMAGWAERQGMKMAEDLWEVYLIGPESSDNPGDWRTELNWQVVG